MAVLGGMAFHMAVFLVLEVVSCIVTTILMGRAWRGTLYRHFDRLTKEEQVQVLKDALGCSSHPSTNTVVDFVWELGFWH